MTCLSKGSTVSPGVESPTATVRLRHCQEPEEDHQTALRHPAVQRGSGTVRHPASARDGRHRRL